MNSTLGLDYRFNGAITDLKTQLAAQIWQKEQIQLNEINNLNFKAIDAYERSTVNLLNVANYLNNLAV